MSALAAASAFDWVTLGAPSASIWRYAFTDVMGVAAHADVEPWYYYCAAELAIWGATLPIPVGLAMLGARFWKLPIAIALVLVAAHMLIGHKEHRYIYPALVLASVSSGIGLSALTVTVSNRLSLLRMPALPAYAISALLVVVWASTSVVCWFGPAFALLRARAHDTLMAADYASSLHGICGIGMGPGPNAWVPYGGYTHIHLNVPLFWPDNEAAFVRERTGFNLLMSELSEDGYVPRRCFGQVCVSERIGRCTTISHDPMPGPVGSGQ